jgi:hypothetical protein
VLNYGTPTPPFIEEKIPFPNTCSVLERINIWLWVLTWPETENDCAGEGQQQFTGLESRRLILPRTCFNNPSSELLRHCKKMLRFPTKQDKSVAYSLSRAFF